MLIDGTKGYALQTLEPASLPRHFASVKYDTFIWTASDWGDTSDLSQECFSSKVLHADATLANGAGELAEQQQ